MIAQRVSHMAEKTVFSHEIAGEVKDLFDRTADSLPGNKYEILEAMIRGFAALPRWTQIRLIAGEAEAWAQEARQAVASADSESQSHEEERPEKRRRRA